MHDFMRALLWALLCGAVSGGVAGIVEGGIGSGDSTGLAMLFAGGLLVPTGMVLSGFAALSIWMLPPAVRRIQWRRLLTEADPAVTAAIIVVGGVGLMLSAVYYHVTVFFMTRFHHMGLAAFSLL
ncbi:MAG: hypothetical protein JXX14_16615, partial [Deltaproteobacteria bacterium]|nr:hypothetical protein [Deltaproteobacteria bacterium]